MRRLLLCTILASIGTPVVFALGAPEAPRPEGAPTLEAALDRACARATDAGCTAWRAEATRPHGVQRIEATADGVVQRVVLRVPLRERSAQLRVEARQGAAGWIVEGVERIPTVRCGTPAFASLGRAIRAGAPAAWVTRIDACRPDALHPVEVEQRATRPIAIRGAVPRATLRKAAHHLALEWRGSGWAPAVE